MATASTITAPRRPWYTILYVQVLIAIAVGILIGHYFPNTGVALKPLGDGFISHPIAVGEELEEEPV